MEVFESLKFGLNVGFENSKNTRWKIHLFIVLALLPLSLLYSFIHDSSAATFEATDNITINITILKVAMVDIEPKELTWLNVSPGGVGYSGNELNNYSGIWIENIGSVNLSYIWLNTTYPLSRPFATGNPLAYDAGNFLVITPNVSAIPYEFVNRVEYPDPDTMYVKVHKNPPDFFGRFRNSSFEYFMELDASQSGNCSNGTLYISTAPKTATTTGDVNLLDNTPILVKPVVINGAIWGITEVHIGPQVYCVLFPASCKFAIFDRWNKDLFGNINVSAYCPDVDGYILNGTKVLYPGEVLKLWARAYVPFGVAYGNVKPGRLTVFVEE